MSFDPHFDGTQRSLWLGLKSVYDNLSVSNDNITALISLSNSILAKLVSGAFGELVVTQRTPVAGWRFDYGVNTDIIASTTANGGSVTQSNSKALLTTAAQVNSVARINTIRKLRYTPGRGGVVRFTGVFSPLVGSQQIIGNANSTPTFSAIDFTEEF